ncbi:OprO/OprP family phosphate-selective porin [Candidatus Nitrosacidococcus tergens]|uniref:OprO/OprP family phosphate-selective porin n=1 Tax=Candidatus Nitrosacidococcus tergens TaxID=553981 RepID=UPI0018D894C8|nr:porin [Candidatus Nitrosacidococcus tergens]
MKSTDGNFTLNLGGQIQADFVSTHINNINGLLNHINDLRLDLRRARINITGSLYKDWHYRFENDFGGNGFDDNLGIKNPVLTNGFFKFTGFKSVNFVLGYQKVPFSLESIVGNNWTTFQERSLTNSFINNSVIGRRRLGVVIETFGDRWIHWAAQTGFYGAGFSNIGQSTDNWGASGRITFAPIAKPNQVIHIGGSIYYRDFEHSPNLSFIVSPESHLTDQLIGTNIAETKNTLILNGEISTVLGVFHAQSEYTDTQIERKNNSQVNFDGWYTQAGYFLTGESRNYIPRKGVYGQTNPNHPINQGGWGAWEIAVRYSTIDLNNKGIYGGEEHNLTLGMNWWITHNALLRANYIYAIADNNDQILSSVQDHVDIFMMRAQLNF